MPELPEVETVRKVLQEWLAGFSITNVEILYKPVIENVSAEYFSSSIINQKINSVSRRGKYLLINLSDFILISHLRMEGKYYIYKEKPLDDKINKHNIVKFYLDDGRILVYNDVRKFGKIRLVRKEQLEKDIKMVALGKEPFYIEPIELYQNVKKSNKKIKEILLDQHIISGLGNIYVDEVLFISKILPNRIGKDISLKDCEILIKNSIYVLNKAIELGGSTVRSYHFANEASGMFQNNLYVYGREDEDCKICKNKIKKIYIGGRGTHFCDKCQK